MKVVEEVEIGGKRIVFELGQVARQAHGAVVVRHESSMLLATVVVDPHTPPSRLGSPGDAFVPLTVEYRERMSAAGRIPGGYGRREARLGDHEILTSRLIDRTLRPLFPKGFSNEVQIFVTVYGADPRSDLESLALLAAAAALRVSPLPLPTVAGLRIARRGDKTTLLPTENERERADLDWIIGGTRAGLVMLEGGAELASQDAVMSSLRDAHAALRPLLDLFDRLAANRSVATPPPAASTSPESPLRTRVAAGERADGRGLSELRSVTSEVGFVPSNHGSALFTRGQTQALVSVTLGATDESLVTDTLLGRKNDRFFLHYNFPPFSVGEVKASRGPGRREIGHGALARRAISAVMPSNEDLAFSVRVVSDILESNGSSSMATICGASLALMDAAVPLKAPVAGIAMGLVTTASGEAILSDISGDEDHFGDMDFKVAGTREGIAALQLDIKLDAVSLDVIERALTQAQAGLGQILDAMALTLAAPRDTVPENAPQVAQLRIHPSRVGTLIGQGGKTVQELQSGTNSRIDVKDDGRVRVTARRAADLKAALARIEALTLELKVGETYQAEVVTLQPYGAFVRIGDHEGLVHISEIAPNRVEKVEDVLSLGEMISVKVLGAKKGRLELSRKAALA